MSACSRTVVQDLRRQYGKDYRVLRAASGQAALDILRQLKERGEPVALLLSDQRMPGMTGVEMLEQAIPPLPRRQARPTDRVCPIQKLPFAPSIPRAIHYYLNKPWDPPEEKLYPVLNDLLAAWNGGNKPAYDGLQVISARWGTGDHETRNFLSRNLVPYQWLDPSRQPEALDLLCTRGIGDGKLPVVLFPDGSALVQPSQTELAAKVGLRTQSKQEHYDVVVVGTGLAGLAAGVYGSSEGLRTLMIDALAPGGQAGLVV